ncbi:YihY/virulence factor BrkB family protein [Agromyces sp. G08B096]|uniref:YihY/virulence factor BrkB family protein n=1 Tax=Agromyces sp. G08B096 TaxID=3156399 RepID=A0AAU7W7Y7_9MICO
MSEHTDSPIRMTRDDWRVILRRTWHEFRINQSADIAAALTYYATLAVFPALLAALAVIGAVGSAEAVTKDVLQVVSDLGGDSMVAALDEPIEQLLGASHHWFAILVGVVGTLWSASGYLGVFGRAMNRILHVEEGRPFWASRPAMLLVAAVVVVLASCVAILLIGTGPVAETVARGIGLDEGVVLWWDLAKLPVAALLVAAVIALLYWATPNVKRRHFRWFSVGAAAALVTWVVTTAIFGLYVVGFGTYERNYGVLGGAVAFLLWVWLSNLAVVFGAVLDTEVERVRQLRAGIPAEEHLQLPLREDRMVRKNREQRNADVRASAELRPPSGVDGVG